MTHIFISYSRQDQEFAQRLAQDLTKLGADIWIDIEDIPVGMKWSTAIQQGLGTSEIMIVIISPSSMGSSNVEDEWQYFLDQKKSLVPVLWKPAEVHFQLHRLEYVDFHTQEYEVALRQLYTALHQKGARLQPISIHSRDYQIPSEQPKLPVRPPLADIAQGSESGDKSKSAAASPSDKLPRLGVPAEEPSTPSRTPLIIGGVVAAIILIAIVLIALPKGNAPSAGGTTGTQASTAAAISTTQATAVAQVANTATVEATTPPTVQATSTTAPTIVPTTLPTLAPTTAPTSVPTTIPTTPPTSAPVATQAATAQAVAQANSVAPRTDPAGVAQVMVSAGCFQMGANQGEDKDAQANEGPRHQVCLSKSYWIDQYEVTNEEFRQFVDDGGYTTQKYWSAAGWKWIQDNSYRGAQDYADFTDPKQPRVGVSWYEADAYAHWRGGRLPTEAEWEYAARGPQSLIYPWGATIQPNQANVNSKGTKPVGSFADDKSWVGAYDMAGNALEWTADWYDQSYYQQRIKDDPPGPATGHDRTVRGGSWRSVPGTSRSSIRNSLGQDYRAFNIGFRVLTPAGSP